MTIGILSYPVSGRLKGMVFCLAAVLVILLCHTTVLGQGVTGTLAGQIIDPSGYGIPGVSVSLRGAQGLVRVQTSDSDGHFRFIDIPVGEYALIVELEGFASVIREGVMVSLAQEASMIIEIETGHEFAEEIVTTGTSSRPRTDSREPRLTVVEVFYGTNRLSSGEPRTTTVSGSRAKKFYGSKRSDLQLGSCEVSIPIVHKRGSGVLESPFMGMAFLEDPRKHFYLRSITPLDKAQFIERLQRKLQSTTSRQALVYIHGFNNTFEDAAKRTAQLAFDLFLDGAPLMYSWPSKGKASIKGYLADEASVAASVPHLESFLRLVASETGAKTIHVVAHSMGNRVFTSVLEDIARGAAAPLLGEVVLVAPDIDADVFRDQIAPRILGSGRRVTLYASARDRALLLSKKAHDFARAGDTSHCMALDGIDTVDVTEVETDFLGHFVPASNRSVITDLAAVLAGRAIPRTRLRRQECEGRPYWLFSTGLTR